MKTNREIPWELSNAIKGDWSLGQIKRVTHLKRQDGTNCSRGKDAALSIVRKADGWWFLCFRCGYSGYIGDSLKTGDEIEAVLNGLRAEKEFESLDCITLPADFIRMGEEPEEEGIPYTAYNWFWEVNITGENFERFNVGWSPVHSRVIVPIYEYATNGEQLARKLIGWIGRDVRKLTKTERKAGKISKYLTRKSSDYKRIFFHAPWKSDTYVIVEDVLSAMKINQVCKVNTFALLTSFVPISMLFKLRGKNVILWLDSNMLDVMVKATGKGNLLGTHTNYIHTSKDPKYYNDLVLRQKVGLYHEYDKS